MPKYINADELKRLIQFHNYIVNAGYAQNFGMLTVDILNTIDKTPTADVVKVKHGHWIDEEIDCGGIYGGRATQVITYCSECEEQCEYRTDFCPNCGADMRERRESE